ncbi:hypothetical protein B0T21DRAFT_11012 [Apiosordaria backusii]|uniref:Uncharacterized protein n=1 Tax=Apiosordaria backusii TaxID=314023 RepID=A0AA40EYS7_9PEZI|nr:hypothetical protein B0T21DRAFT_11012 [Apiosordaria backusii]
MDGPAAIIWMTDGGIPGRASTSFFVVFLPLLIIQGFTVPQINTIVPKSCSWLVKLTLACATTDLQASILRPNRGVVDHHCRHLQAYPNTATPVHLISTRSPGFYNYLSPFYFYFFHHLYPISHFTVYLTVLCLPYLVDISPLLLKRLAKKGSTSPTWASLNFNLNLNLTS